jgi:DNA-directed RNA polymerase subunit RPC12/RpoP
MDDSNFPNGVCKKCHKNVSVLKRKSELQAGDVRYECKNCGYVSMR